MDDARAGRLAPLTGLRFLAALGILLFHYGGPLLEGAPAWAARVQRGGYAWVGLFYVLSGFVLARAHPEPMLPAERRAFLTARVARLYPAYLLAFALSAPFALQRWSGGGPLAAAKGAVVAGATLLAVQAWAPPIARLWNPPGWSTSVLAACYATFPWVAGHLARRSRAGLAAAFGLAWAAALALPLLYLATRPDGPGAEALRREPRWLEALKFHPLARSGEFVAGVALGLLHRRGLALARGSGLAAALALAATFAVLASGAVPYVLLHNGFLLPVHAVAVLGLACGGGFLGRVLGSAPARVLGEASFALYALQDPLWRWARTLLRPGGEPASPLYVLGFAVAATAIAVAVSTGLERPARRALRGWLGAARAPSPAAQDR